MSLPLSRRDYACDPNSLPVQNLREEIERKAGLPLYTIELDERQRFSWSTRLTFCASIQGDRDEEDEPENCGTGRNYVCALNGLAEELGVELERDSITAESEGEAA